MKLLLSTLLIFSANLKADEPSQINSSAHTFLTTIFQGDLQRSAEFLSELKKGYKGFLQDFQITGPCSGRSRSSELANLCTVIVRQELELLKKGTWSQHFRFDKAEFLSYQESSSIGTYNFSKQILFYHTYMCRVTMQISAVLNASPDKFVSREFFTSCSNSR